MKRPIVLSVLVLLCAGLCAQQLIGQADSDAGGAAPPAPAGLATQSEQISYSLGLMVGMNFRRGLGQYGDVDPGLIAIGFRDAVTDAKPKLDEKTTQAAIQTLQQQVMAQRKTVADANTRQADAFLAENGKQTGVTTTDSGLQYKILQAGDGASPASTATVVVHYTGKLLNGQVFDSSYKRGQPAQFRVDGVIGGWTEALQLMQVGSKWQLFIPPNLAYGPNGSGQIPPNALLTFDVELIEIKVQE